MKTRLITAAVLVPALIVLVLVAAKLFSAIVLGLLLAVAAYELLYRTGYIQNIRLLAYSIIMAFAISMWSYYGAIHGVFVLMNMAFFALLFAEMMMDHIKVRLEMLCMCFLAGEIVPYMLSSLVRILGMASGRIMILMPFVIAFLSDAGAYFVGIRFGKHKLCPVISPHKTIEGLGGGLLGSLLGMLIYAVVLAWPLGMHVNFLVVLLYAVAGSLVGTLGDLCFSVIKRQCGIKDYGNLLPGHGGVLDRLDSMVMVAPFVEAMLLLLPLAV